MEEIEPSIEPSPSGWSTELIPPAVAEPTSPEETSSIPDGAAANDPKEENRAELANDALVELKPVEVPTSVDLEDTSDDAIGDTPQSETLATSQQAVRGEVGQVERDSSSFKSFSCAVRRGSFSLQAVSGSGLW